VPKYRVTFEVGPDQTCWWEVDAENAERAKAEAALRFYNDPVWSSKSPHKIPASTAELVREHPRHGDTVE
jgi:hypothetical protein